MISEQRMTENQCLLQMPIKTGVGRIPSDSVIFLHQMRTSVAIHGQKDRAATEQILSATRSYFYLIRYSVVSLRNYGLTEAFASGKTQGQARNDP